MSFVAYVHAFNYIVAEIKSCKFQVLQKVILLRVPVPDWLSPDTQPFTDYSDTCLGHSWDCSLKQLGFSFLQQASEWDEMLP